jgi:DNA-binding response OmpR family regulator
MKRKILIVDDNPHILEAIAFVLETEDYNVETVSKSEGVEDTIKKYQPDLILLDLLLSGRTGEEITKVLKMDKKMKNIPIIIISAHPTAGKIAKDAGADGFIAKPFDINLLLDQIQTFLPVTVS